ncbi:MAG TPA: B12-binding domain-containing radical SAM protein [Verrucomicrobia bacterium]|nr:B12-binding domain-containing radical SAM protein [Verrucomicrobiota bacterium]
MKVLLLRLPPPRQTIGLQHVMLCEPLELEILAAAVRDLAVDLDVVDMMLDRRPLRAVLRAAPPDLVAMSGYITHIPVIKAAAREIHQLLPDCKVIVGGIHAEVCPQDVDDPHIDFIVAANGWQVFREIVRRLAGGENPWGAPLPVGLWRRGESLPEPDFTAMPPPPDRAITQKYRHHYYYLFHKPCALMKTSYGCPYGCRFCFCREITRHRYTERPMDAVIAELRDIAEPDVYIVDDNFLVSRERVLDFCQRVREAGILKRYLIYGRADFIAANPDVLSTLRKAGLRAVIVGLESCAADELDAYAKQTTTAQNEEAVAVLADLGVDCYATLILGTDWNRTQFRKLGDWLQRLGLQYVNLQPFTPLPGTEPYAEYAGRLITHDPAQWDLAHLVVVPGRLSLSAYYWEIIRLYWRLALRPATMVKHCRAYGVRQTLRLGLGATRVTWQYLGNVVRSL